MTDIAQWGIEVVLALQRFSPALDGMMRFLSFLGKEEFYLVLFAFLYWCVSPGVGVRALGILLFADIWNHLFKLAFHAPRPYWVDAQVKGLSVEGGYGIPSGHAQNAVALWVFLAAQARRPWAWAAAAVLILAISLSRVYLGVHFPHDIAAGWVIGAAVLAVYLWAEPRVAAWLRPKPTAFQVAAALAASVAIFAAALAVTAAIAGIPDPAAWEAQASAAIPPPPGARAINPRSLDGTLVVAGAVFGVGAGLALASRSAPFDAGGPWSSRLARLILGLVVLMALRVGLGLVFPREPEVLGWLFRALRYAAIGLWAIWGAPQVFIRLGLARTRAASG